jgi:DNA-binding response OmpR family regulator
MKVLLIDDDTKLTTVLKIGLEEKDFKVEVACDGYMGMKLALANKYDLIILDIMMPGIDGFELCKKIRYRVKEPVLMISSLNMIEDRVAGFNSGADDYMIKPFSVKELLKRIKSLGFPIKAE